jgi:hypothetical protein
MAMQETPSREANMKRFAAMIAAQRALWFGLAIGLILGLPQPASAQMQEGMLSGTFAAFGTVKATAAGKERLVLAIDENGLSVTNGVLNYVTWHCSGLADFTSGVGQAQGFCAGRDPVGDQVVFNWESEKHAPGQKIVRGTFSWTGGTGKYAGIRGAGTYVDYSGEFQPLGARPDRHGGVAFVAA